MDWFHASEKDKRAAGFEWCVLHGWHQPNRVETEPMVTCGACLDTIASVRVLAATSALQRIIFNQTERAK